MWIKDWQWLDRDGNWFGWSKWVRVQKNRDFSLGALKIYSFDKSIWNPLFLAIIKIIMHRDYDYELKICLVGDTQVGKTSLIQRYADNCFD
jgi:hypothetical protein